MGKSRKAYSAAEREAYAVHHQLTRKKKGPKALPSAKEMENSHKEYLRLMRAKRANEERLERELEAILERRRREAEEAEEEERPSRHRSAAVVESAYAKEFAAKEAAKEEERLARRLRASASLLRAKENTTKKKQKKEIRYLTKRLGLEYKNYDELRSKYYNESVAAGLSPETASRRANSRAYTESDPSHRFLSNKSKPIGSWADLLNIEDELYPERRLLQKAAKGYGSASVASVASASVASAPKKSASAVVLPIPVSAGRLERIGTDFTKLAIRNLPIDITMKKLYSKFGSKAIFPDKAVDEKLIVKMKLPTTGIPVTKKGRTVIEQIPRGFAFLTYMDHESAQRVLDYHREHPITFNHKNLEPPMEMPVLIEPSYTADTGPLSAIVEEE